MSDENDLKKELVFLIDNHIYFYTDVNEYSTMQLVKLINTLNNTDNMTISSNLDSQYIKSNKKDIIFLHINSCGGNLMDGFLIYDSIRLSKKPIYTICEGNSSSIASIILLAGKKRFMTENSYILIHEVRYFYNNMLITHSNLNYDNTNSKNYMLRLKKIYKNNTNIDNITLNNLLKKEIFFNSKKALKFGFINKII